MKIHKLTVLIVDQDDLGVDEVIKVLENQKYPNWCISPDVIQQDTVETEWDDDHPVNLGKGLSWSEKAFKKS